MKNRRLRFRLGWAVALIVQSLMGRVSADDRWYFAARAAAFHRRRHILVPRQSLGTHCWRGSASQQKATRRSLEDTEVPGRAWGRGFRFALLGAWDRGLRCWRQDPSRSQALPGNALLARLRLARKRQRGGALKTLQSQAEPGIEVRRPLPCPAGSSGPASIPSEGSDFVRSLILHLLLASYSVQLFCMPSAAAGSISSPRSSPMAFPPFSRRFCGISWCRCGRLWCRCGRLRGGCGRLRGGCGRLWGRSGPAGARCQRLEAVQLTHPG